MDVDAGVGPRYVLDQSGGHILRHGAVLTAWERPVHIQVAKGHAPGHGADAQRVQRRVDVHRAVKVLRVFFQQPGQPPGHILALQLIAVGAGHHTQPLSTASDAVFLDRQVLAHGQGHLYDLFDHK